MGNRRYRYTSFFPAEREREREGERERERREIEREKVSVFPTTRAIKEPKEDF